MTVAQATSPLRRDQARAVRQRIIDAALSVIEAGEEPSMRAVARAAQVSERTLYRYYGSLEALQSAVFPALRRRASAPLAEDVEGLCDYIGRLFTTFEDNAPLVRALVGSRWAPRNVTRPANLAALRKLIDQAFPDAPAPDREAASASLRVLYSAASFVYLDDCGFDLEAKIRHVQWITRTTIEALTHLSGGQHA